MQTQLFALQYAVDTFFILISGVLVMWMAAGFSMLEAGLVRTKNTADILAKNILLYAVACLAFMAVGYHLMYGGGSFLAEALRGPGHTQTVMDRYASGAAAIAGVNVTEAASFFFQVVFVAASTSIISGAVAERMRLWSFLLFAVVMTGFIYPISGSWVWGGRSVFGLFELSLHDFAGAGVVHLAGASAALAAVLLLGPRRDKYGTEGQVNAIPGANIPLATIGMFMLWFGWFGFNGGSLLRVGSVESANTVAWIFVNTNTAAAAGMLVAAVLSKLRFGVTDVTLCLNGALGGAVAITAGPETPAAEVAMLIGAGAGLLVVGSIVVLDRLKIDDPVGAISVHGAAGFYGLMMVPVSNAEATVLGQLTGALVIMGWVFGTAMVVWTLMRYTIGIRVTDEEETEGLDIEECGMEAYPEFRDACPAAVH